MKRKSIIIRYLAGLVLVFVFTSCAKLPIVNSQWHESVMNGEREFNYYDSKSKILYRVSNDSTHLYVSFEADDQVVKRNILLSGAKIYVDTNLKKKGTAYLQYPLMDKKKMQQSPKDRQGGRNPGGSDREQGQGAINPEIEMPLRAVFVTGGEQYLFDSRIEETDFETAIVNDKQGVLYYLVGIPLDRILSDGANYTREFAVGINIESPSMPAQQRPAQGGGMRGGSQGGGMSGGERPEQGGQQRGNMSTSGSPVKIWFKTSLFYPE